MSKNLVAKATASVNASKAKVWNALVTPAAIKQYMFGTDVQSDWHEGSAITWTGEMNGERYEDKGVILTIAPHKTLQYSHFSALSGKPDKPENYHTVTIELTGTGKETNVSLTQDNNADEDGRQESEQNWSAMLDGLKEYVERSS